LAPLVQIFFFFFFHLPALAQENILERSKKKEKESWTHGDLSKRVNIIIQMIGDIR